MIDCLYKISNMNFADPVYDKEMPNSNSKFSELFFVHTARKFATAGIARQMRLLFCWLESTICTLPVTLVFRNCHTILSYPGKSELLTDGLLTLFAL